MNQLLKELQRRNVIRVAIAYLIGAWLLLQITEVLSGLLELPASLGKMVVVVLAIGFPLVVAFAWVFELTPEGIKRESEIQDKNPLARQSGKRLNVLIIVMLALAAGYFFWEARIKAPVAPESPSRVVQAPDEPLPAESVPELADEAVSIAVLPFANMSADPENEFFADGLSEEILNQLAQVPDLRVIARTSSFAFRGQNRDLREIGDVLGSNNILEGSVRRQGKQVRVTAQLIETENGAHLWSQTWDRELDDVFAIQDEIAQKVANALNLVLDEDTRQAMLDVGVRNVDAFVAYQKGYRAYIDAHRSPDMIQQLEVANQYLDAAIAAAPDFASAYARKTDYYAHLVLHSDISDAERQVALDTMLELYAVAREKARDPQRQRAIDLDRTFFTDDWSRLPNLLRQVFDNEECADGNWMELAIPFSETADLKRYYQRQIDCDPMMVLNYSFLAEMYMREGDLETAQEILGRGRAIGGDHRWLRTQWIVLGILRGQPEQVLADLQQVAETELDNADHSRNLRMQSLVLSTLGRVDEARSILETVEQAAPELPTDASITVLAMLGDREGANTKAAAWDATPGGYVELVRQIQYCDCGAPFDLEVTPRLAARIREAGFSWPPPGTMTFPAKDW